MSANSEFILFIYCLIVSLFSLLLPFSFDCMTFNSQFLACHVSLLITPVYIYSVYSVCLRVACASEITTYHGFITRLSTTP